MELKRRDFRKWLENKSPRAKVGETNQPCCCPLACWIGDTQPAGQVSISPSALIINGETDYDVPRWAAKFMNRVDSRVYQRRGTVTAQRALEHLEAI